MDLSLKYKRLLGFARVRVLAVIKEGTGIIIGCQLFLATSFYCAFAAKLTMCIQKTVQIKLKFIWDPLVEMKVCLIPVRYSRDPTNGPSNLKHLQIYLTDNN